ncbi:TetR/AcrR family transcriptional regulator [Saccharomonospora azurea]|uniref:TetR/AcrR family transcriptional regulator n=1 Tax=Saccharomonospora azurea TaxID=40988 RepID=UPI00240954FE|nr:TetR/AcrR family transcriptional regulator [Saccharomonospora azurea]
MATTRRERLRAALDRDLRRSARRLLVAGGIDAVTLAAIAREVGITPPAIYRYYRSRDDLLLALADDLVAELVGRLRAAAAVFPDECPDRQITAMIRAFTAWATKHRAEFGFVFAAPPPVAGHMRREITEAWTAAVGGAFGERYLQLWQQQPFEVPGEDELEPGLLRQLETYRAVVRLDPMPLGAILVFIECWSHIYASISFDVFGLLSTPFPDLSVMHERMCRAICERLGISYEPPASSERD